VPSNDKIVANSSEAVYPPQVLDGNHSRSA
jgi:hypothetical protein